MFRTICVNNWPLTPFSDLSRLFRASYASSFDEACQLAETFGDGGNSAPVSPSVTQILDKLQLEARHYRPVNLCAEISVFSPMHWSDIGGYSEIKGLFKTTIQQRLLDSADPSSDAAQANKRLGLSIPRGVLLHGPPG